MIAPSWIIELRGVSKRYGEGDRAVWAVRDVSFALAPGEFLSITGPSGSGKSSLLHLMAGLDLPTTGDVYVDGDRLRTLSSRDLARLRREKVAFIFQFFNLIPSLNAERNVAVPLRAQGLARTEIERRVSQALEAVGMKNRAAHHPEELSGGELQRVAIARALATDARVILADEPTGNLDSIRGEEILEVLKLASENEGRAVVLVTHDPRAAAYGDRVITLRDGQIVDEIRTTTTAEVIPFNKL